MKYLIVFLFLIISISFFAQPKGAEVVEKKGVKCYVHIIQPGNTLYGLHRLYTASVEDILKHNPEIKEYFKPGEEVIIPLSIIQKDETGIEKIVSGQLRDTIFHEVESKETLYGISRKYATTIDYIKENNEILQEGLHSGQRLVVGFQNVNLKVLPKKELKAKVDILQLQKNKKEEIDKEDLESEVKVKRKNKINSLNFNPDVVIKHKVLEGETLYSISKRYMIPLNELYNYNEFKRTGISKGDIINVPVITDNGESVNVREISDVSIEDIDSNYLHEEKNSYNIAVLLPFFLDDLELDSVPNKEFKKMVSSLSTDFLMGLELAIDSLEKHGLSSVITVYDTKNDSNEVAFILDSLLYGKVDLIIGPFFAERITEVSSWCYINKVKMVCPVSTNLSVLKGNPFVDIAISSDYTLMEGLAKYTLGRSFEEKVILIDPQNEKDKLLYDHFRETYLSITDNDSLGLIEAKMSDYKLHLQKAKKVILVFPSTNEGISLKFISDLMSYTDNRSNNVTIFTTKEWLSFESIKGNYLNKFNIHFSAPNHFSFKDTLMLKLARIYREKYDTDITKIGALGYDVANYLAHKYLLHNTSLYRGVMGDFEMLQKGEGNGFENNAVWIIQQKNYELLKVRHD